MTKVLRKYNKWFLGIGGSLLMVTFLLTGPQSIFQPSPNKRPVATMGGRTVRQAELHEAESELEALKAFAGPVVNQMMHIESGAHWLLLTKEASEAGLVGAESDGDRMIPDLAMVLASLEARQEIAGRFSGISEQMIQQFFGNQIAQRTRELVEPVTARLEGSVSRAAASSRLSDSQFRMALAKLRGVMRMQNEYMQASRISDRRAVSEVKRLADRVLVDAVVIPASRTADQSPEPTEAQITEQYIKYKDVKPGTGEFGFGYLQPQRVKLEWMVLDRDAIGAAITIDQVDVRKEWQQHRDKYKGEFVAEKANVEKDLKGTKVDAVLADADKYYKARLRQATRQLQQNGPVKQLPADWDQQRPTMAVLATVVTDSLKAGNAQLPAPSLSSKTDAWVKLPEAGTLPGVGTTRYRLGTKQGSLGQLLGELHELNAASTIGLQMKIPFENGLTDGKGNVYYINVLDARAESAPESMDEVKPDIIKDVKTFAAYQKLLTEQDTYKLLAVKEGLDSVAKLFGTPAAPGAASMEPVPLPVMTLANVQRETAEGSLNAAPVRDTVMSAAAEFGPLFKATPDNLVQRTLSAPVPEKLSLAIIVIQGQAPVTVEDMRTLTKTQFDGFAQGELMKVATSVPFSFEALKERYDYKPITTDEVAGKSKGS